VGARSGQAAEGGSISRKIKDKDEEREDGMAGSVCRLLR
jgi:hypothetical protein